jgi:hypothetical protein
MSENNQCSIPKLMKEGLADRWFTNAVEGGMTSFEKHSAIALKVSKLQGRSAGLPL